MGTFCIRLFEINDRRSLIGFLNNNYVIVLSFLFLNLAFYKSKDIGSVASGKKYTFEELEENARIDKEIKKWTL